MKSKAILLVLTLTLAMTSAAVADVIVLNFEGPAPQNYPIDPGFGPIGNYYAGLGVTFSDNALALCLNTANHYCSNTSRGGLGDPTSQTGGLFFLEGSETFMNYVGGFSTGFSLFYTAIHSGGSLNVYDGPNGTGNVLATLSLPTTVSSCDLVVYDAGFCPFVPVGVSFSGTAYSIGFAGVGNQIVFDDVTFGSVTPGVPEPASMVLLGSGLLGLAGRLRKKLRS